MKVAIVRAGVVTNIAVGDVEFLSSVYPDCQCVAVGGRFCDRGMRYSDEMFCPIPSDDSEKSEA